MRRKLSAILTNSRKLSASLTNLRKLSASLTNLLQERRRADRTNAAAKKLVCRGVLIYLYTSILAAAVQMMEEVRAAEGLIH